MGRGGLKERGRGTGIRDRGTRMGEMWSADVIWRLGDGRWSTDGIHRQPHIKKKNEKICAFPSCIKVRCHSFYHKCISLKIHISVSIVFHSFQ